MRILFAYLDPATGSLVIQTVIGLTAGVVFFGRRTIMSFGQKMKTALARTSEDTKD